MPGDAMTGAEAPTLAVGGLVGRSVAVADASYSAEKPEGFS